MPYSLIFRLGSAAIILAAPLMFFMTTKYSFCIKSDGGCVTAARSGPTILGSIFSNGLIDRSHVSTMENLFPSAVTPGVFSKNSGEDVKVDRSVANELASLIYGGKLSRFTAISPDGERREMVISHEQSYLESIEMGIGLDSSALWHGVDTNTRTVAEIYLTGSTTSPSFVIKFTSPEGAYLLYREDDQPDGTYAFRTFSDMASPSPGESGAHDDALANEGRCKVGKQSTPSASQVVALGNDFELKVLVLMHREPSSQDERWKRFLNDSIAGLSSPSAKYRAKIQVISRNQAGLVIGDDVARKLYEVMNWARSVNTSERAHRILVRNELFRHTQLLREQYQADLVIIGGNEFPSPGNASTNEGADEARFFALVDERGFKSGTTVAHEVSHLLGAKHQIYVAPTSPVSGHASVWPVPPTSTFLQRLSGKLPSSDWQIGGTADSISQKSEEYYSPMSEGSTSPLPNAYSSLTRYPRYSGASDVDECTGSKTSNGMAAWNNSKFIRSNIERLVKKSRLVFGVARYCPIFDYRDESDGDIQACPDIDIEQSDVFFFNAGKEEYYSGDPISADDKFDVQSTFNELLKKYENRGASTRSTVFVVTGFASSEGPTVNWHLSYRRAARVASDLNGLIKGVRPRIAICPVGDIYAGCFERTGAEESRLDARRVVVTMSSDPNQN